MGGSESGEVFCLVHKSSFCVLMAMVIAGSYGFWRVFVTRVIEIQHSINLLGLEI
jgi:hypothetical protein